MNAAGNARCKLALNLSRISQPWVRVAAMVVSDIIDKLSPNIAPLTKTPATNAGSIPVA